jgi:hypothetical protein
MLTRFGFYPSGRQIAASTRAAFGAISQSGTSMYDHSMSRRLLTVSTPLFAARIIAPKTLDFFLFLD